MNTYVSTITIAYGMRHMRSAVRARLVAFVLYLGALIAGSVVLPLLVATPKWIVDVAPDAVLSVLKPVVAIAYWPVLVLLCTGLLATLYHVAVPVRLSASRPDRRTMDGPQVVLVTVEGGRVRAIEQFVGDPAAVAAFWA